MLSDQQWPVQQFPPDVISQKPERNFQIFPVSFKVSNTPNFQNPERHNPGQEHAEGRQDTKCAQYVEIPEGDFSVQLLFL
jgi:hypothetical protein